MQVVVYSTIAHSNPFRPKLAGDVLSSVLCGLNGHKDYYVGARARSGLRDNVYITLLSPRTLESRMCSMSRIIKDRRLPYSERFRGDKIVLVQYVKAINTSFHGDKNVSHGNNVREHVQQTIAYLQAQNIFLIVKK